MKDVTSCPLLTAPPAFCLLLLLTFPYCSSCLLLTAPPSTMVSLLLLLVQSLYCPSQLLTMVPLLLLPLCPESSENIPILLQEADPYFPNQNDLRNPKMGSKQSVTGPPLQCFFQITFLVPKNHRKHCTVSLLIHSPIIFMP